MKNKKIVIIAVVILIVILMIFYMVKSKSTIISNTSNYSNISSGSEESNASDNLETGTSTGGKVYVGDLDKHNYYASIKTKSLGHPEGKYSFAVWTEIEENKKSDGSHWHNDFEIGFFPEDVEGTNKTNLKNIKIDGKDFKYYIEGDTARLIYNTKEYDYDFCIDVILEDRILYNKEGNILEEAECIITDEMLKSKAILDEIQFEIEEE